MKFLFGTTCILLATAVIVSILLGISNRELRAQNERLHANLEAFQSRESDISIQLAETTDQLETSLQKTTELQSELELLKAMREEVIKLAVPKPYRVETYLGKHHLGQAWVSPHNIRTNQESGLVSYDPVVYLNEKLRTFFTEYRTNTVERQIANIATEHNKNYNYYPQVNPYWFSSGFITPTLILPNTPGNFNYSKPKSEPSSGGFMPVARTGSGAWSTPFSVR